MSLGPSIAMLRRGEVSPAIQETSGSVILWIPRVPGHMPPGWADQAGNIICRSQPEPDWLKYRDAKGRFLETIRTILDNYRLNIEIAWKLWDELNRTSSPPGFFFVERSRGSQQPDLNKQNDIRGPLCRVRRPRWCCTPSNRAISLGVILRILK